MSARDRIEVGWFGWPARRGWSDCALHMGARALVAIERVFIKPTRRRGDPPRRRL